MIDLDYHKGHPCIYPPFKFCQEGYCSGCNIYLQKKETEQLRKIFKWPLDKISNGGRNVN
jgi:hypothetical protein